MIEMKQCPAHVILGDEYKALREIDERNKELRERNIARAEAMKQAMGTKYVLHAKNAPMKQVVQSVLG